MEKLIIEIESEDIRNFEDALEKCIKDLKQGNTCGYLNSDGIKYGYWKIVEKN